MTFSCFDRLAYLGNPVARDLFLVSLEAARREFGLAVHGYVAMPEHVHLLVAVGGGGAPATLGAAGFNAGGIDPEGPIQLSPKDLETTRLEAAIKSLQAEVGERLERRPCWLGGFDDLKVHTERQRTERLMYMHRNPVLRGLARQPKDWRWSSFLACSTGLNGLVEVVGV